MKRIFYSAILLIASINSYGYRCYVFKGGSSSGCYVYVSTTSPGNDVWIVNCFGNGGSSCKIPSGNNCSISVPPARANELIQYASDKISIGILEGSTYFGDIHLTWQSNGGNDNIEITRD
jgi:hypothetical protein